MFFLFVLNIYSIFIDLLIPKASIMSSPSKVLKSLQKTKDTMHSIIFKRMSPDVAIAKLHRTGKSWLLRESRQPGCLTVDSISASGGSEHLRFALIKGKWQVAHGVEALSLKRTSISLQSFTKGDELNSLLTVLAKRGFALDKRTMLNPTAKEKTSSSFYSMYKVLDSAYIAAKTERILDKDDEDSVSMIRKEIDHFEEQETGPISFEELGDLDTVSVVGTNPKHWFKPGPLATWIKERGTHPMTREPATVGDIVTTDFIHRSIRKLAKIDELTSSSSDEVSSEKSLTERSEATTRSSSPSDASPPPVGSGEHTTVEEEEIPKLTL